ncbi:MAG: RNA 3'-terminal phosphate cyclase [Fibrobacterota bacterium]|nr:RNA 3'-terminal phosphate cyclase [Chitinispirillaceae bacterium]
MITLDGSRGEGGGQILRTSLSLSMISGQPFTIKNIRAGRPKPGLMRQHLAAVNAAATISNATVDGVEIGSKELVFKPSKIKGGTYTFSIGSAGSCTLVFQTVFPALIHADVQSTLHLEGGTHNPFAPPYDYLCASFLPVLARMGVTVTPSIQQHGFFPAGGGRISFVVNPCEKLTSMDILERGESISKKGSALIANLPHSIALRECNEIAKGLNWSIDICKPVILDRTEPGFGNVVYIEMQYEHCTEVISECGDKGVPAERVAEKAVHNARKYIASGAPVGEHLADQLMIPFVLAGSGSYCTMPLTQHSLTNIETIRLFTGGTIVTEETDNRNVIVSFKG